MRSCSPAIQPSTKTYEEESCHSERDRHSQSVGNYEKHSEHRTAQGNRGHQYYERRWTRYETAGDAHADQATAADRFMGMTTRPPAVAVGMAVRAVLMDMIVATVVVVVVVRPVSKVVVVRPVRKVVVVRPVRMVVVDGWSLPGP